MAHEPLTSISVAQNSERAQRLLAAQSRLYTDAKRLHDWRVLTVTGLGVLTVCIALTFPSQRILVGAVGGAATFLWSVLGSERERRRRREAASVQEEFDTHVFNLPWNNLAVDPPSPTLIAEAASRYRGNRTKDWYPHTGAVVRPLDVLICQRSNLGWGASMHRLYAAVLAALLVFLPVAGTAVALLAQLTVPEALTAVLVPLLAPARELIEMIKANRDSTEVKTKTEAKVLSLWSDAMADPSGLTVGDCRGVQDRILGIRQTNAHVPDWLDKLRLSRQETVMQQSAEHLIEEASRHGRAR